MFFFKTICLTTDWYNFKLINTISAKLNYTNFFDTEVKRGDNPNLRKTVGNTILVQMTVQI